MTAAAFGRADISPVARMVPVSPPPRPFFDHEKLAAYRKAVDAARLAEAVALRVPPMHGHIADQLRRAAVSIPLNIAEGAGEFSAKEKARFYQVALRSTSETASALDHAARAGETPRRGLQGVEAPAPRIVALPTRMAKNLRA